MNEEQGEINAASKLKQIADAGLCVWYQVPADVLGRIVREASSCAVIPEGTDEEGARRIVSEQVGMAVVEYLSSQVSRVFIEMEIFSISLYHALLMIRAMCGEAGRMIDAQSGMYVDLDIVLGLKQPARFTDLNRRLVAILESNDDLFRLGELEALKEIILESGALRVPGGEVTASEPHTGEPDKLVMIPVESDMILEYGYFDGHIYIHWKKPGKGLPFGRYTADRYVFSQFDDASSKGQYILKILRADAVKFPYEALEKLPD